MINIKTWLLVSINITCIIFSSFLYAKDDGRGAPKHADPVTTKGEKPKLNQPVIRNMNNTLAVNSSKLKATPTNNNFDEADALIGKSPGIPNTKVRSPALSPARSKPTTIIPVMQPNAITNNSRVSNTPAIGKGINSALNNSTTTKNINKRKPVTKVKIPINKNTTSLPYSRNMPTIKQPALSGVPVAGTNKPRNRNLVAVPIVNGTSGLSSLNKSVNSQNSNQLPAKKSSSGFVPGNIANTPAENSLDSRAVKSVVKTYNAVEYKKGANLIVSARWVSNSANWLMDKCILKEIYELKPRYTNVWKTSCDLAVTVKNVGDVVVPWYAVTGDFASGEYIQSAVQLSLFRIRKLGRDLDIKLKQSLSTLHPGQEQTVVYTSESIGYILGRSRLLKIEVNMRNVFVETKKGDNLLNIRISDF